MRSPGKICTHTCTHTSTYAHTCMHMHWSASNLFSFLSLFCSFQWQPSHPRSSGVPELCHEGRVWRYLPNVFRTVSLWGGEESPAFPPKAIGWPRLMLSTVKTRRPSHRGALVWKGCSVGQCRVGRLSLRCLLTVVEFPKYFCFILKREMRVHAQFTSLKCLLCFIWKKAPFIFLPRSTFCWTCKFSMSVPPLKSELRLILLL